MDRISSTQTRHDSHARLATLHVHRVIAEGRALTRALEVVEVGACPTEARKLCSSYLQQHEIASVEDLLIAGALQKICGLPQREYTPQFLAANEIGDQLFHEGASRWLQWAYGVDLDLEISTAVGSPRSTFNRMALNLWLQAIDRLQAGDLPEGRRFFRRATTLSGHYGTSSNPPIQWTYAASFFPLGPIDPG